MDSLPVTCKQLDVLFRLVEYFNINNISYQVTGGLAGNLYGSLWPLHDIDIELNLDNLYTVEKQFSAFVVQPVARYVDEEFDIWLLKLVVESVEVDINAVEDFCLRPYGPVTANLADATEIQLQGRTINVQPLDGLIAYKQLLRRDKDVADLLRLKQS